MTTAIPPFFIGQRVVCVKEFTGNKLPDETFPKKDTVYTVRSIILGTLIKTNWYINLVEIVNPIKKYQYNMYGECIFDTSHFSPILENFKPISLTKILEQETELIGKN